MNGLTPESLALLHCAAQRAPVRLEDGRTARLISVTPHGQAVKVQLPSGAYLWSKRNLITVIEETA